MTIYSLDVLLFLFGFSRGRSGGLVFPSLSEFSTVYCGIVNKAEIHDFLELSCFFHCLADVCNLISGSSVFSKTSLNIWKFLVHVLLKPGLENFQHYVSLEHLNVQAGFRKGRRTRNQIADIHWIIAKSKGTPEKTSTSALLTMPKPLTVWITKNYGKFLERWEYQVTILLPEKPVYRSRSKS